MIDPISAIAIATTAFNTIKKGFEVGRDIESMYGDMGRWMGAIADIDQAEKMKKKPTPFKKFFDGNSVEQQALNAVIAKKKIEEQEKQVRELITWAYGVETYKEMMQMRKDIKAKRERMIYKQRRRQRRMLDASAIIMGLIVSGGVVWTTASIIQGLSNG